MSFLTFEDISVFKNPNMPVKSARVVGKSRQWPPRGDIFCQLKIKKSIPRSSKGSRKGLRGREGWSRNARSYGGWLRRDFLPIKHYFPLWSVVWVAYVRTYPFLSHILIPRFPTLFSRYFSLLIPSRQQQGRLLQTLQWPLARSRRRI